MLVDFYEKTHWDFDWNCTESADRLGENRHRNHVATIITVVYFSIYLGLFHLFQRYFVIFSIQVLNMFVKFVPQYFINVFLHGI